MTKKKIVAKETKAISPENQSMLDLIFNSSPETSDQGVASIACATGKTETTVKKWRDHLAVPDIDDLRIISDILGLSADELINSKKYREAENLLLGFRAFTDIIHSLASIEQKELLRFDYDPEHVEKLQGVAAEIKEVWRRRKTISDNF